MRLQKAVSFCAATVIIVGVLGCQTQQKASPELAVRSVPAEVKEKRVKRQKLFTNLYAPAWRDSQFEDIPIPPDCVFVPEESYVHTERGFRVADLKYKAEEASMNEVFKFFQERMPASNWIFQRLCGLKMKSMAFVKGREECIVNVGEENGITIIRIKVHIRTDQGGTGQ